jgi:hypothetical protein
MNQRNKRLAFAIVAVLATAACTLILDTSSIIKPCTSGGQCDKGFACVDNACLPEDEAAEGEGED